MKYDVIYIDPPYWYQGQTQHGGRGAAWTSGAHVHYPTMSERQLAALPLPELYAKDCIMFCWTTGPQLEVTMHLLSAWKMRFKTVAFVWDKVQVNPGAYTMSQCEYVIAATKGKIPAPRGARNVRQYLREKRTTHSVKPEQVRSAIDSMFPTQRKIELFARVSAPGWDRWGFDAPPGDGLVSLPFERTNKCEK